MFRTLLPSSAPRPLVVNSPHSGRLYPLPFLAASRLKLSSLRRLEDFCVDALVANAPALGAYLLTAQFPRLWLDVNRAPDELDRALLKGPLPAFADTTSPRARAGSGLLARLAGEAGAIYHQPPDWPEAQNRLRMAYFPYHAELARLLAQAAQDHASGAVLLLDCHSMPSSAAPEADIVLGDVHGRSVAPALRDAAFRWWREAGLRVAMNHPYAGGHITAHYGRPAEKRHALQVEISRALYMDERHCQTRTPQFSRLRTRLGDFIAHMAQAVENAVE